MMTTPATISSIQRMISEIIQREYTTENMPVPATDFFPAPIEHEFLVFRARSLRLWMVLQKPNDPDRKVIVFDPNRHCFGIATHTIATIPGKGFFICYCDSFHHALEKAGIELP